MSTLSRYYMAALAAGLMVSTAFGKGEITLEVNVDQFWGYIVVAGGGWTGNALTMDGEVKTTIATQGPQGKVSFEVSAKASHKFSLMSAKNWVLMFGKLMDDYIAKFPADKF
jgi:carbon monoxide dehydrogenase subunit G